MISPILANVFLHEVLDAWFEDQVKPRLRGQVFLARYADDAALGFSCEEEARYPLPPAIAVHSVYRRAANP